MTSDLRIEKVAECPNHQVKDFHLDWLEIKVVGRGNTFINANLSIRTNTPPNIAVSITS